MNTIKNTDTIKLMNEEITPKQLLLEAFLINLICISWSAKKPIEAIISRRKNRKTYLQLLQNANNNQQN